MSSIPYYSSFFLYVLSFACFKYFGSLWFMLWITHAFVPLFDYFLPLDNMNPTKEEQRRLDTQIKFKIPIYLCIVMDWTIVFWIMKNLNDNYDQISVFQWVGIIWGLGISSNINFAHELMHKANVIDKYTAMFTLSKNMYMHFWIEHVYGHHKNVALRHDPASARLNESIFKFIPRSIFYGYLSAWNIEKKRLQALGLYVLHPRNRMLFFLLVQSGWCAWAYWAYGRFGVIVWVIQGFGGVLYLEAVNYIEHYGLERKETSLGVYEKVDITHSWNAPQRFSNYMLFKLQRHSDHHENGYKPYQSLCTYESSPMLPHGYPTCTLVAFSPKVWFEIMNARIEQYKKQISPIKEEVGEMTKKVNKMLFHTAMFFTFFMLYEQVQLILKNKDVNFLGSLLH
jgi:alkane 1-monooxygenase